MFNVTTSCYNECGSLVAIRRGQFINSWQRW